MTHFEEASRLLRFVQQEVHQRGGELVLDERVDLQAAQIEATLAVAEQLRIQNLLMVVATVMNGFDELSVAHPAWDEVLEALRLTRAGSV